MRRHSLLTCAGAAALAAGCGGGQSSGSSTVAAKTSKAGNAVLSYFGQPQPLATSSSANVTVLSQAGATYNTITLEPPPNLADTYLIFGRAYKGTGQIYQIPYATGEVQPLYQSAIPALNPAISAYGTVAFNEYANFAYTLNSIRSDGTGLTTITMSTGAALYPHYAIDGTNRLSYSDGQGHLYVGPGTGGTGALVQSNDAGGWAAWNTAGTELSYLVNDATAGNYDIYETAPSGGTATDITPPALRNTGDFLGAVFSPDGVTVLTAYEASGGSTFSLVRLAPSNPAEYQILTPSGDNDIEFCYSPDGSQMAFYRESTNGATPGIYVADGNGDNAQLYYADPAGELNSEVGGLEWSPFLPKETVVGASGSVFYHQAASGFLLSQISNRFGSMVAFTATTPSSAAIQSPSSTDGYSPPLVFTITADSITEIGYINDYFSTGTTVSLTSTPTAVVSVDGVTGQVDIVAPASVSKATRTKNSDGTVTYAAPFKAIYNGKGQNLAPNGAQRICINPKTGKLLSFK